MDIEGICEVIGRHGRTVAQLADELVGAADAELDARIRDLELMRRRVEAELAVTLAVAEQRQTYLADGHRGMAGYLRATCNWSNPDIAVHRRLATAADAVPGLADALHSGRIGIAQATSIAKAHRNPRVRDRLVEFAPTLLDLAERLPFDDFTTALARFEMLADTDGAHEHRDRQMADRNVRITSVAGELHMDASGGDVLINDELQAIFRRYCEHEFRKDTAARRAEHGDDAAGQPLARTARQRRYDAFIELMRRANQSLDSVSDAPRAADPLVNVIVDHRTWALMLTDAGLTTTESLLGRVLDPFTGLPVDTVGDLLADLVADPDSFASMRCETSNGTPLHPHDVLRAALAGHIRRVVIDAHSVPIDMGRKRRLFTGSSRQAAKLLISHCDHTGCNLPADFCEVDHIHEWGDLGATDQTNAGIECDHHNRLKHTRRFTIRRDRRGRRHTIRPDGTIVLPVGVRPPTFPDESDDVPDGLPLDDGHTGYHTVHLTARELIQIADIVRHARAQQQTRRRAA